MPVSMFPFYFSPYPTLTGFGLFAGGYTSSVQSSTLKYGWGNDTWTNGTALGSSKEFIAGCGNATVCIFNGGNTTHDNFTTYTGTTDKYTYSTDTRVAGTSTAAGGTLKKAASNSTTGLLGGGSQNGSSGFNTLDGYTFSNDAITGKTSLTWFRSALVAFGNSTVAIFGGGTDNLPSSTNYTATDKHTYSANTTVASTNLTTQASRSQAGAGNTTHGYYSGGYNENNTPISQVGKWVYSNSTTSTTTSLSGNRYTHGGASNSSYAFWVAGYNSSNSSSPIATTEKTSFVDDSASSGTSLSVSRGGIYNGASSAPAHF